MIPPITWAGNAAIGKYATAFIGPFSLSFFRWLIATSLLMTIAAKPLYQARAEIRAHWFGLLILGILGIGCFNTLLYLGLTFTSVNNAAIIQATMPITIIALSYFIGQESTSIRQITGLLIAIVGVVWVITRGDLERLLAFDFNPGDLIVLGAVGIWTLYSVLLKKWRPESLAMLPFMAIQFLVGLAFIFPLFLYEQIDQRIIWQKETYLILIYVSTFPSLIAYYFWQQGIAMGGANLAGLFIPFISVFAALFAYLFLGETLKTAQLIGGALVIAGVTLAFFSAGAQRSSRAARPRS